jgi:hypothetical protein
MPIPAASQSSEPRPIKAEIQPRETIYVYHWDRILGVLAVLLLLLAFIAYGLYTWVTPQSSEQSIAGEEKPSEIQVAAQAQPPAMVEEKSFTADSASLPTQEDQEQRQTGDEIAQETAPVIPPPEVGLQAEASSPAPVNDMPTPSSAIQSEQTQSAERPSTTPAPPLEQAPEMVTQAQQPIPQQAMAEASVADQAEQPANAAETVGTAEHELSPTEPKPAPFRLLDVQVGTPQVKRFVLPKRVINKEPHGELSEIRFKADGSAAVWCYSEVIGKPGSTLRYVWYHEGKQMARVPVAVYGRRWRSYSSKIINQRSAGAWRVELQDGAGRLLASADFQLR